MNNIYRNFNEWLDTTFDECTADMDDETLKGAMQDDIRWGLEMARDHIDNEASRIETWLKENEEDDNS